MTRTVPISGPLSPRSGTVIYGPYTKLRENYIGLFAEIAKMGYEIADAPRACYVDGIWNQEDPEKWFTIIQVPVRK